MAAAHQELNSSLRIHQHSSIQSAVHSISVAAAAVAFVLVSSCHCPRLAGDFNIFNRLFPMLGIAEQLLAEMVLLKPLQLIIELEGRTSANA